MVFPIISVIIYRKGITDGIDLIKNKEIKPLENPQIKIFTKKEEKEDDVVTSGFNNLMTYDGNPPKGV
jgi:hypothetical protein